MPYIEAITRAGKTMLVERYFTSRYNKSGQGRCKNEKELDEAHKKADLKKAVRKLTLLLNANFEYGDYHLVLTYERDSRPHTPQDAKKDREKFLRNLRQCYKKNGQELKYVVATEYGKRSSSALHHHLVINKGVDTLAIQKIWKKGRCQFKPLDEDGEYSQLASYMLKYRDYWKQHGGKGKQYNCSRNLVTPSDAKEKGNGKGWLLRKATSKKRLLCQSRFGIPRVS